MTQYAQIINTDIGETTHFQAQVERQYVSINKCCLLILP